MGVLVASQLGKNVYRVSATGEITELAKEVPVPAAIGYDSKRHRLLIPQIALSSVTMVDLPPKVNFEPTLAHANSCRCLGEAPGENSGGMV